MRGLCDHYLGIGRADIMLMRSRANRDVTSLMSAFVELYTIRRISQENDGKVK